jgi:NAD(P)-dependent dehydrogenase (short-subunit alcohol dehydrogenase family)
LVTGAGSGIGRAIADLFAHQGARIACVDISGQQAETAAHIGSSALGIHADISREDDVREAVAQAESQFGHVDIVVNNAGFGGTRRPIHEQSADEWDRVHATNLRGTFLCMKYGIACMLKNSGGAIVNIGSATGVIGWKHHSIYGAAKAGVHQLTKAAALDYADFNIRVNAIAPGIIWTGLAPGSKQSATPPPQAPRVPGIPIDRWGLATEIAQAALYLASDAAAYVTGVVLPVDGGYFIGYSGMGAENAGV